MEEDRHMAVVVVEDMVAAEVHHTAVSYNNYFPHITILFFSLSKTNSTPTY